MPLSEDRKRSLEENRVCLVEGMKLEAMWPHLVQYGVIKEAMEQIIRVGTSPSLEHCSIFLSSSRLRKPKCWRIMHL